MKLNKLLVKTIVLLNRFVFALSFLLVSVVKSAMAMVSFMSNDCIFHLLCTDFVCFPLRGMISQLEVTSR